MQPVLDVAEEVAQELRELKIEKGGGDDEKELDFAFLFVVDVVQQRSLLLVCSFREYVLAREAFPGCSFRGVKDGEDAPGEVVDENCVYLCDVGTLSSREAHVVPALDQVLSGDFRERIMNGAEIIAMLKPPAPVAETAWPWTTRVWEAIFGQ